MLTRIMVEYDYRAMGKKGSKMRWAKVHSSVRIHKKLSKEKIAIMAYICGDGYIAVRDKGFHHDIYIALDDLYLAKKLAGLFLKEFNILPRIKKEKTKVKDGFGYYSVRVASKPACLHLLSIGQYGGLNWTIPSGLSKNLLKEWIKCFFDCEAYVNYSKRQIQVKSVNGKGLGDLQSKLFRLKVQGKVYGPFDNGLNHNPYFMLSIFGRDNLITYGKHIGFYHPKKSKSLQRLLNRYKS